jgi:transmembrane sensor
MDANDRRRQVGEEAADWWVLLNEPTVSRSDRERFVDWLGESAQHVAEFLHISQVHGALDRFKDWGLVARGEAVDMTVVPLRPFTAQADSYPSHSPPNQPGAAGPTSRKKRGAIVAMAAVLTVLAVGITWFAILATGQTLATERGERRELSLADGSTVQMAPATRLRVAFKEDERGIVLEHGRALFKVAKDPSRPFIVKAGQTQVRAVGTAFAVEQRAHDVLVTVSGGEVAVTQTAGGDSRRLLPFTPVKKANGTAVALTAGEQIALSGTTTAKRDVRKVDSKRELAWVEGRLIFERTPLGEVVAEFNRYNRIQFSVTDAALAGRPISAIFDAADPESFLSFVEAMAPVRVVRRGHEEIAIEPAEDPAAASSP